MNTMVMDMRGIIHHLNIRVPLSSFLERAMIMVMIRVMIPTIAPMRRGGTMNLSPHSMELDWKAYAGLAAIPERKMESNIFLVIYENFNVFKISGMSCSKFWSSVISLRK